MCYFTTVHSVHATVCSVTPSLPLSPVWQEANDSVQPAVSYFSSAPPWILHPSPPSVCPPSALPPSKHPAHLPSTWELQSLPDVQISHICTHKKGGGMDMTYDWSLPVLEVTWLAAHTIPLLQKCATLPIQYILCVRFIKWIYLWACFQVLTISHRSWLFLPLLHWGG